jgi:glycosyltransferase involved in cell wall biosynthesis
MKALVIAPQPFFSPRGTPFSVYYRTLITAELGVKVDILTYGEGQDVDIENVRIIRIPHFRSLGPIKVGPSYLKLFLDIFMMIWTVGLLLKSRYEFVWAHEEAVFFCWLLKPIFRFKLVYDMHSSLPQQLINFKFTKSKFLIKMFEKLEILSLRGSDLIITVCPSLSENLNALIRDQGKQLMIENSIFETVKLISRSNSDTSKASYITDSIRNPSNLPKGKRLIVYAGTLEPYQGIDILVKAFKKVVLEIREAFLVIVGGNKNQIELYSTLAAALSLDGNILFTGQVSQNMAKHFIKMADALVSPRSEGTNTPMKIYEYLSIGKPLITTNIYSHTQVLNDDIAFLVNPVPEDMARGIIEALKPNGKSFEIAANAKRFYKQKYSRSIYEKKMQQILELLS